MKKILLGSLLFLSSLTSLADASFADFDKRAKEGEVLNVVYFGASLTFSANASDPDTTGFRGLMSDYLVARYPKAHFRFHNAAIGGTPSTLGLFRMERDVLSKKPDLVFLDFVCNDGGDNVDPLKTCAYEQILRTLIAKGVPVEQLFFTFKWWVDAQPSYERQVPRQALYRRLGEAYGTPCAFAAELIRALIKEKKTTVDGVWPIDGGHPADYGYTLFFEAAKTAFEKAVADGAVCRVVEPVFGSVDGFFRRPLREMKLPAGWKTDLTFRTSMWYDGLSSRWMGDVAVAKAGAEPLALEATGNVFAFFGEAEGPRALMIDATIDGEAACLNLNHGCDGRLMVYSEKPLKDWQKGVGNVHRLAIAAKADEKKPNGEVRIESLMGGTFKPTAEALEIAAKFGKKDFNLDAIDHARGQKQ